MSVALINQQDVIDFTALSVNVTEQKYKQYIIMAQDRFLSELIGRTCYNELTDRVCSGVLLPEDDELLSRIKPYLVNLSYSIYVSSSMRISTNQGIVSITGDNATAIGETQRVQESKKYVLMAMSYRLSIEEYLIDNSDVYTCFDTEKLSIPYSPYFGL